MKIEFDKQQLEKVMDTLDRFAGKKARTKFQNAFNRAGFDTRKRMIDHIGRIFKNANNYTRNAPYFNQLNFNNGDKMGGFLAFKKKSSGGVGPGIYLMPQEWGGARHLKGFELKLGRMGMIQAGMFAVPTKALPPKLRAPAALERLANDLGKVISRIDSGKRKGKAKRENFFVVTRKSGNLEPGIYMRQASKQIRLFAFVTKVTYRKIFNFYAQANKDFSELFITKLKDEVSKG